MALKIATTGLISMISVIMSVTVARAEVVRFDFDGTITNRFNNGLPNPSDIFGLTVNVGDAVSGSFTIDTSAMQFGSLNGSVGGSAAGYTQSQPLDIRVNLGGGLFSSDGDFASSIANDYQDNTISPPFEQFSVSDGVSSGTQDVSGDTILLDGNQETARLSISFTDNEATAFDSTMLPTALDLSMFEISEGTISGTRPSGQFNPFFYQAAFRVDSISAVAIPEPSSLVVLGGTVICCLIRRRRAFAC